MITDVVLRLKLAVRILKHHNVIVDLSFGAEADGGSTCFSQTLAYVRRRADKRATGRGAAAQGRLQCGRRAKRGGGG